MLVEIKTPADFSQLPENSLVSILPKRGKTGNTVILILWNDEGIKCDEIEVYNIPLNVNISKDYIINVSNQRRYKLPMSKRNFLTHS